MSVILQIEISDLEYRALSSIAIRQQVNAHVLIEQQVSQALAPVLTAYAAETPPPAPEAPTVDEDGWEAPLGLEPLPPSSEGSSAFAVARRRERVRVLFAAGFEDPDIARSAGMPISSVRVTRSRLGLIRRPATTKARMHTPEPPTDALPALAVADRIQTETEREAS
ncbi:hypothetical protein GTU73_08910 [Rathayibacter sp. VKM Ac-2804]|uniref:hypothetical protein n=1 Tax=Rathayibacter sp. VKM Ac-2804 TaxID=2609257 RepID=UPI00132F2523|nr:hypothetical protein [Rathayibacter sp. VKM Ac-2804]QHF24118.1 hypothetical protein GTU73_08910 [Rathayibacter sp. VKM Ac-2804]